MTNERTQAYGRCLDTRRTRAHQAPAAEQARIRDAADTSSSPPTSIKPREALRDIGALAEHLLSSGRWLEERLDALVADLLACGPAKRPRRRLDLQAAYGSIPTSDHDRMHRTRRRRSRT